MLTAVRADAVVQDPMKAQANSFGWLAIRNVTYCLSSDPDPANKPRGVQPKTNNFASLGSGAPTTKQLTGMGDSVVVLYHPENTNKAIAWCNTLVAFQSTEHVKCHIALPTCQRCDAVRSKDGTEDRVATTEATKGREREEIGKNRAPSGKLGQPRTPKIQAGTDGYYDTLVALQRKGAGGRDPNDPWVRAPGESDQTAKPQAGTQPQTQPQPASQHAAEAFYSSTQPDSQPGSTPRQGYESSIPVDVDASTDPELEAAISEFQDYCENKLTLAVRADCPLHMVRSWTDEPPFDLQRFCMTLRGANGYTLHTTDRPSTSPSYGGLQASSTGAQMGGDGQSEIGNVAGGITGTAGTVGKGGSNDTGKSKGSIGGDKNRVDGTSAAGALDPNDPLIPFPTDDDGKVTTLASSPATQPKTQAAKRN
ncbi:hypothetical protein EX895_005093 [Sporisorium graminicola]|uniref:Uncharacterized protein n=1 Tax=Sporisorium graminicola TaxID=280036 RepID=A0A4U7KSM5_9BASI|nr:hypothetical protein EX895_005093 [Sporisorium graminicola]TKY86268.1 hypothetical protein EX895_005093 [Sporisorium graminicola]